MNKKFFKITILLSILLIVLLSIIANPLLSHSEIKYKTINISPGDTLWEIARKEQNNNEYYKNEDIRFIVFDISTINELKNNSLSLGSELKIPIK